MTVKEECYQCGYFNPKAKGHYKCNTARCPTRNMDIEERSQLLEEREFDSRAWKKNSMGM